MSSNDGKLIGSTPFSIKIEEGGSQSIQLKMKGYEDRSVELSSSSPEVMIRLSEIEEDAPPEEKPAVIRKRTPKTIKKAKESSQKKEESTDNGGVRDPWAD